MKKTYFKPEMIISKFDVEEYLTCSGTVGPINPGQTTLGYPENCPQAD